MNVTFLGAGDMFSFEQGHNSIFIEFDETNLVIDFPESNCRALLELGRSITDIQNIFITHLHEDHINGLQLIGNYFRVHANRKPVLFVHSSLYPLLWQTLRTGMEPSFSGPKKLEDFFDVRLVETEFAIGDVIFQLVQTRHLPGMISHGLLAAPYFYFSGDTSLDRSFVETVGENVQLIFHECHLQTDNLPSHTSLDEIMSLKEDVRSKIVLMHYVDDYADRQRRHDIEQKTGLQVAFSKSVYHFE